MTPLIALINGQTHTEISVQDRGLHYGDGLFETVLIRDAQPVLWEAHCQRLCRGQKRLGMPLLDIALLTTEALKVCAGRELGVLKVMVTRGSGGRGYRPPATSSSELSRIVLGYPYPAYPRAYWQQGVALRYCQTRLGLNPALAGIKHLNRLEHVLARQEWDGQEIAEGLMLDMTGQVVSGTMTNLFIINDQILITPELTQAGIEGIMRLEVLTIAEALGMKTSIQALTQEQLRQADELFVTNSLIGLWPVRTLAARPYILGPWTTKIRQRLETLQRMPDLNKID